MAHTRMATESAVTVLHSHPFVPARDLCVVHNGSFSNYATVRRRLEDDGVRFDSDNDSEVAARFLAVAARVRRRPRGGDPLGHEGDGRLLHARHHERRRHVGRPRRLRLQAGRGGRDARPTSPWPRSTAPWPSCRASPTPSCSSPIPRRSTRGAAELDRDASAPHAPRSTATSSAPAASTAPCARCPTVPTPPSSARGAATTWPSVSPHAVAVAVDGNAGYFLGGLCGAARRHRARHRRQRLRRAGRSART